MKTLRLLSGVVLLTVLSISCSSSSSSAPQNCDEAQAATDAAELAFNASTPATTKHYVMLTKQL